MSAKPEIKGTPVFAGTHVPVKALTDYIINGNNIEQFLDDFPEVSAEQVVSFLDFVADLITREHLASGTADAGNHPTE